MHIYILDVVRVEVSNRSTVPSAMMNTQSTSGACTIHGYVGWLPGFEVSSCHFPFCPWLHFVNKWPLVMMAVIQTDPDPPVPGRDTMSYVTDSLNSVASSGHRASPWTLVRLSHLINLLRPNVKWWTWITAEIATVKLELTANRCFNKLGFSRESVSFPKSNLGSRGRKTAVFPGSTFAAGT
jgi:hypothetical protein